MVWASNEPEVRLIDIVRNAAPILWFSPDEKILFNEQGKIRIPMALPVDTPTTHPVVYYKLAYLYTFNKLKKEQLDYSPTEKVDLEKFNGMDIIYYYYFDRETGLGSHHHDIESMFIQFEVITDPLCKEGKFQVVANRIVANAHGNKWYQNSFLVDEQAFFPPVIFIGEGKHASCTDKNADGVYTPGYDVTQNINDAWGVRDIETSGILFSGQYQGWMTKRRTKRSLVAPPIHEGDRYFENYEVKFSPVEYNASYELRPYPNYLEIKVPKDLVRFMKDKKPHDWPVVVRGNSEYAVARKKQTADAYNSVTFAFRWDNNDNFSLALPLLLFKNVKAPMTGGWLYNKVYFGNGDAVDSHYTTLIGHQIVHTSSASRWLDPYLGMGYEVYDANPEKDVQDYYADFVSEIGLKLRVNIRHTPARFLRFLGTDFWGLRLGWKNVGFRDFRYSGFVIEFGAGVF